MIKHTYRLILLSLTGALLLTGCDDSQRDLVEEQDRHVRNGIEQAHLKNWDKAVATFRKALEEKPQLARPHLELALIYHQEKKNYIYAVYHYEQYLAKRPESEKRSLIQGWVRQAKISLAAQAGRSSGDVSEELVRLTRENNLLRKQLEDLKEKPAPAPKPAPAVNVPKVVEKPVERIQTPAPRVTTYKVLPGDTLSRIARTVYGDSSKFREIYNANKDQMQNENDLKVGQMLRIPELKK